MHASTCLPPVAQDSPFFTVKLNIKVLPYIIAFRDGVAVERVIGFEPLGGRDDWATSVLEDKLLLAGVIGKSRNEEEEEDNLDEPSKNIRKSSAYKPTNSDEDSDFD